MAGSASAHRQARFGTAYSTGANAESYRDEVLQGVSGKLIDSQRPIWPILAWFRSFRGPVHLILAGGLSEKSVSTYAGRDTHMMPQYPPVMRLLGEDDAGIIFMRRSWFDVRTRGDWIAPP